MEDVLTPRVGTVLKLNITAILLTSRGIHLNDNSVDYTMSFYVEERPNRILQYRKGNPCIKAGSDDDNYIVIVPTRQLGAGTYWMKIKVEVPDNDVPDAVEGGIRTEVAKIEITDVLP